MKGDETDAGLLTCSPDDLNIQAVVPASEIRLIPARRESACMGIETWIRESL